MISWYQIIRSEEYRRYESNLQKIDNYNESSEEGTSQIKIKNILE